MPELPEVETIAQKLKAVALHKQIIDLKTFHPKSFQGQAEQLVGEKIEDISRRAKIIRFRISNGVNVLVHLKMTGQLIYVDTNSRIGGGHPTADWVQALPSKHTRIQMDFDDESQLFFNDQRLFGWWRVLPDEAVDEIYSLLAPDINDPAITPEYVAPLLARRRQAIKLVMLDPAVVAGLGNIYINDALNLAKIHPLRPANSLSKDEIEVLIAACKVVIEAGIKLGGTTFDGKYVDIDGMAGEYQSVVRVYGREGKPCLNCGGLIQKIQLGGRGTYFCPDCQV